ncbi:DUF2293 domain-containing protein [Myxococcota bacterium]|nr:DUF2293 domain-containing protein [Myxococcota bacterium]MBU1897838.1 DUF2293 domain-containing protein [Myxococcota bacterium]
MPDQTRVVAPHYKPRMVRLESGEVTQVPEGWQLLPPGDAGLTRRVKAAGPSWSVKQQKGRRLISHGIWAPAAHIERALAELAAERATPTYQRRRVSDRARRDAAQAAYVDELRAAVRAFLSFHERHAAVEAQLAEAVTQHAAPVGSGTVARTQRISVAERAEAAVIAWMRHQTTAYDTMKIARIKGERRAVRAALAQRSRALLKHYREGAEVDAAQCPLARALGAVVALPS